MNQFFKQILASTLGTMTAVVILSTVGVSSLFLLILTLISSESTPPVQDKSFLVFDLSTSIRDRKPTITLGQALSGEEINQITLRNLLTAIDKAAQDERILGIFLDGRGIDIGNGYGTLQEVYQALERFKATGKKIIAYDVDLSEKEYYLATLADTIILNPMGDLEFNGLGTEQMFYAGAMEKYGIGVQVVRVGEFKAAVEPYTRQNLSKENRQQVETLLIDIWGNFLKNVSKNRKIAPAKLQTLANTQGILTAEQAQKAGLIDKIGYLDEVITDLRTLTGQPNGDDEEDNSFRQISLADYVDVPVKGVSAPISSRKVAIVYADGTIVNGEGGINDIGGESFAKTLRTIRQDDEIKSVVLRINSPGGSATASDIILREVQLISQKKPVVVSMGNVAASGGYWIATGAKHIFAQPDTLTGSIGVFGLLLNVQELGNNNGITWDSVQTSPLATLNSLSRPKTSQELAIFQQSVNRIYDLFLEKVATSRNLSKSKVAEIAQGRVWSGEDAQKIGLVDEIGGLQAAIDYAVSQAELGKDWEIVEYPQEKSLEELFFKQLSRPDIRQSLDPLTLEWLKLKEELASLRSLDDPQGVYTRLPFSLNFR